MIGSDVEMQSNVSMEDKLSVLQAHIKPVMGELGTLAVGLDLTGDDLIEWFALGIAAVIENDTHLTTPRHRRLAAEGAAKLIEQRAKDFGGLSAVAGVSVLDILCSDVPVGGLVR